MTCPRRGAGRRSLRGGGRPRQGGARGECARASAALPGFGAGREAGSSGGARESGAGLRRLSLQRLASRLLRLHRGWLFDRPARVRAAPVGLEAPPVRPADLPSLWRGHLGGLARVSASVSAASALPASCLPPLHPRFCPVGSLEDSAPRDIPGQTLSGRQLTFRGRWLG